MSRRARRALIPLIAVLLGALLAGPAGAATVIDVVDADRMEGGAAVQVTVAVTCDPIGPDSQAFVSMTLWQGTYPRPNYIEGFGSFGELGGISLVCDGTPHTYSFTVRPSSFYADKRFRAGPAWTESGVQVCTLVAPDTYHCEPAGELVREQIRIRP
jgi:hypothetical protein